MDYDTPLPPRPILITMDDNYIPVYDEVFPLLLARGMKAVNFAHTTYVGVVTGSGDHCDWNEIRTMETSGEVITESHTKNHLNLTTLSNIQAQDEITGSKSIIEANIPGKTCRYLAYPYGAYNSTHVTMCQTAGYRAAFTTVNAMTYRTTPRYEIPRLGIDGASVATLQSKIGFTSLPAPPGEGWTLDNRDPNCTVVGSGWATTTAGSPYGADALAKDAGSATAYVRWAAKVVQGGNYRVYARWTAAPDRATNATYQIVHASGVANAIVNQQTQGGQWNLLGEWVFTTTQPAEVRLSDAANGSVSADAVWFEPVSARVENFELY